MQSEASFRLLFDSNPVPMIVCSLDDERILGVNGAAIQHYGYSRVEFEKLTIRSLHAFDPELPWAGDRANDEQAARTWKHVRVDGTLIDLAIYSRQLVHGGQPAVLLAMMDITERKRAEARLAFMAQHDDLTGLPNRNLLHQQMDDLLLHTRRSAEKVAVLVLGLDNFKAINDTLGHGIGDELLRGVAKRLRSTLREEDVLARLNSDEFAIVQSGVSRPEDAVLLARRLLEMIGDPYLLDGHSVMIGASIGIAMSPGDGDESEKLLKNADMALSRTKNDFRGTFSFFEAGMDARAQTRRKIEIDLREAIQNDLLRPYYQPLVDLSTGRISGFAVGDDGVVLGRYTNGQTRAQGQVVLGNFINAQGLAAIGNNQWVETSSSGQALVSAPGSGSLGTLQSGALEEANVDLTEELVSMITAQRVYQANAQTIKTEDQVMQTLVNLR